MVTGIPAGKAVDGGVQTRGRGWARLANPRPVIVMIGLGVLVALAASLAASQARSGPAARTAAGDASGMAQQQFLERNAYLPVGDSPSMAAGQAGSQQRQLAAIDARDNGRATVPGGSAGRPGSPGWVEARDSAVAPASLPQATRQQAHLRGIEVRDNGAGTTGGDSGPCRTPASSCNR